MWREKEGARAHLCSALGVHGGENKKGRQNNHDTKTSMGKGGMEGIVTGRRDRLPGHYKWALAETLRLNTTLTSLNIYSNDLGDGGGRAGRERADAGRDAAPQHHAYAAKTSTTMAWERAFGGNHP